MMDSIIISGVRINFPRPGEKLPIPSGEIRSFAVKSTADERCCLLAFVRTRWIVLPLPEFNSTGQAITAAVKQGKLAWR